METNGKIVDGRVRKVTPQKQTKIDQAAERNIKKYQKFSKNDISKRLDKLRKEWDIERMLEVNASSLALTGMVMGLFNRKWFVLPAVVSAFMLQHGLQGWSPPLTLFKALGYRTRQEIDEEIYALKVLRGDIDKVGSDSKANRILKSFRT